ncbi:MAG: hypothetical protein GZ091_09260 [Paludibacter sp.]|nr:hypothetical protein [Paludibacter sp.]
MKKNLLLLIVLFCAIHLNAQNLLVNPGFETWANGKPTGWTFTNTTYISQNNLIFTEGATSCKINTGQSNNDISVSQSVTVTAGKTYTLKLSYYIEQGDGEDALISCYFKNSANKAIAMSLEDSLILKGPGGKGAYLFTELGVWKTYTCDIVAPIGATDFVFNVQSSAYSIVFWDNFSFSLNTKPTVYVSKTDLIGFNYTPGNGPSSEKSFIVKGSNLIVPITVTAPLNYEISTFSGSSFDPKNSIIIPQINGFVNSVTIYTRLKSNLTSNTYGGNITVVSANATSSSILLTGTVGPPPATINNSILSLSGFTYNEGDGPSNIKSFTVSGSGLTSGITISAPESYEISIFAHFDFSGSNSFTISQSGGNVALITIYVRLKAGLTKGSYFENLSLTSGATTKTTKTIAFAGAVNLIPKINVSSTTLTDFGYVVGNGPSAVQFFTVSGKEISPGLIITASSDYEISTETGSQFSGTSQLVLSQSSGIINSTLIYVRLKANLTDGSRSGSIVLQTGGGITNSIYLSGLVSVPKTLTVSTGIISELNYLIGNGPSNQQSFSVSADGLLSDLIISAPAGFELSTIMGTGFLGTSNLVLPISSGKVLPTSIYVRLAAGLGVSKYLGQIDVSSNGITSKYIALDGNVLLSTDISGADANQVRIYSNSKNIIVQGAKKNETVELFSFSGKLLQTTKSTGETLELPVQHNSAYIVRINSKAYKVVL